MTPHVITGLRVTQEQADVDTIEAAAAPDPGERIETLLAMEAVNEAFVLQTCVRTECYVVTKREETGQEALAALDLPVPDEAVITTDHTGSLRHLLRVAAGLESFVLGEDPVLGQVRDSFETAKEVDGIGSVLKPAVLKAIHVGERARDETGINNGPMSIGGAAARVAARDTALETSSVLVIGAGKMGTKAAKAFAVRDAHEVTIANRTVHRAERLASNVDCPATGVSLDALPMVVPDTDIIVSATGSRSAIVTPNLLPESQSYLVFDLAQPRDVQPSVSMRADVKVYDLDRLRGILETTEQHRQAAVDEVKSMIEAGVNELLEEYKRSRVDGVVSGMYKGAERIKQAELDTVFSQLEEHGELTEQQREDIEAMADSLVAQLLASPTQALRDAAANDDWETITTAIDIFDPHLDRAELDISESFHAKMPDSSESNTDTAEPMSED